MKEIRKIAILGVRDNDGNYYACNSYNHDNIGYILTPLVVGEYREAKIVEVFPYTTFTSFSYYKPEEYSKVILEVNMEMSEEELNGLTTSWIYKYQFKNRKISLIREIEKPWAHALNVYNIAPTEQIKNGINYVLCTWHSRLKFNGEDEFLIYQTFPGRESIHLTEENLKYLPRMLSGNVKEVSLYDLMHQKHNRGKLNQVIDSLDTMKLAKFIHASTPYGISDMKKDRINKEFLEELIRLDSTYNGDYLYYLTYMDDNIIKDFGADFLLEKCIPELFYLKKDHEEMYQNLLIHKSHDDYDPNYDPNADEYDTQYEDEDYYDRYDSYIDEPDFESDDEREREEESISCLFPHLTQKSLPILQTLALGKFTHLLNPSIREQLTETPE